MSGIVELLRSRRVPQVAVLTLMSVGFAGCSGDMSTRFSQNSYSNNPFAFEPQATGSVAAAPSPQVERRELPQYARPQSPYQSSALPPPAVSAPQSYPAANAGVSGGGRGLASYSPPPAQPKLETTGTVPPRSAAAAHNAAAQGGTTIIVGTSDTLEAVGAPLQRFDRRDPAGQWLQGAARAIARSAAHYSAPGRRAGPRRRPPASQSAVAPAAAAVHVVNKGDTLLSISRRNHVPVAELAKANNLDQSARLSLGMKLKVPGAKTAVAPAAPAPAVVAAPAVPAPKMVAAVQPQSARLVQPTANVEVPAAAPEAPAVKPSEATGALPTFRWPVRGKVITSYGAKTNGKSNDGINLAVPEGTPVKAAEDGVVAYSGNELKGYGNLVLVRHSNGYVTAYAHASELMVKRGDTIKRGQVIAKSGQSGEVGSPQLHFEIRKGSSPVDPLQFLNGA